MKRVLLGFSWGHRNGEPGLSNEDMADYAVQHWNDYVHHSLQIEIAKAVRHRGKKPEHEIVGFALKRKLSRDSSTIVKSHLDGLAAKGYKLIDLQYNVLCKEEHWLGCKWFLLRELSVRGVTNPIITRVPVRVRFDPQSSQWYTRSNSLGTRIYKAARGLESLIRGEIRLRDALDHFVKKRKK